MAMDGQAGARFGRENRLRSTSDFRRALSLGKRRNTSNFRVVIGPGGPAPRLGLTVSRKVGRAWERNRLKRLVREFFRRHKAELPQADLVVIARPGAAALSCAQVWQELKQVARTKRPPGRSD